MALKIRLRQMGRNNTTVYRLVLTDVRNPRDGKYIECLGWYNPYAEAGDKHAAFEEERIRHWLSHGAALSENATSLLARTVPSVAKFARDKELAQRAKKAAKRKERRKAKK